MHSIFIFGTLHDPDLLATVLDRRIDLGGCPVAVLSGHEARVAAGDIYPVLFKKTGATIKGVLLHNLSPTDQQRLDFYNNVFSCGRSEITVVFDDREITVEVFIPLSGESSDNNWDLQGWMAVDRGLSAEAATEVMAGFGTEQPKEIRSHYTQIQSRALSRLSGEASTAPSDLRSGFGRKDIVPEDFRQPYRNFFTVEEHELRFRRFDGELSNKVERAVFVAGDAVTVLPYDPVKDTVLLIEQFRAGPYARKDPNPWMLEPIAGRRDPGESVEDTARREALEEAGLTIGSLERIAGYYATPGYFSEYLYSFVGVGDLPDSSEDIHGLDTEDEDIRSVIVPFAVALNAIETGEIETGPLVLSMLWLQSNRTRLQNEARNP